MKKLLLAATAAVSMVSIAELSSANIVGFSDTGLNAGYKLLGTTFTMVGNAAGAKISDLAVKGYLGNENFVDAGSEGDFNFQFLDSAGRADGAYAWFHAWDWELEEPTWAAKTYWYDIDAGEEVVPGSANDVTIPNGKGIWFYAPANSDADADAEYVLTVSGEVYQENAVATLEAGYTALANPYPTAVKVSDLTVSGYLDNENFIDAGSEGDFNFQFLDSAGRADGIYTWVHMWDWEAEEPTWATNAYWYDFDAGTEVIAGSANDIEIPAGKGIWFYAPAKGENDADAEYKLTIKSPVK